MDAYSFYRSAVPLSVAPAGSSLNDLMSAYYSTVDPVVDVPGEQLGYTELGSNGGGSSLVPEALGLSTTVDVGTRPLKVEVTLPSVLTTAANLAVTIYVYEDGVEAYRVNWPGTALANALDNIAFVTPTFNPSEGQHTYAVYYALAAAGTFVAFAEVDNPSTIRVVSC